jgi:hypothetical protein
VKKYNYVPWLVLAVVAAISAVATLYALDTSGSIYTGTVNITNTGTADRDDLQASFYISGAALVDASIMTTGALNAVIVKGATLVPSMPPNNRINIKGAVTEDDTTFTEKTTEALNDTAGDVPLLPTLPVAGEDAFYYGCSHACRIITIDLDQAGVGTWTLAWEYWNGTEYKPLSNVDDRTASYTVVGRRTVSWDQPTDWASRTTTGSSVSAFWLRAKVDTFSNITTQPLAARLHYENGEWWTWVESIPTNNQEQLTLFLGGPEVVPAHQIFPGDAGITTTDNHTIEVTGSYVFGINSRLNFSAPSITDCIICKTGSFTVSVSGSATAPAIGVTAVGATTTTLDMTGITMPDTGAQTMILAADGTDLVFLADAGGGLVAGNAPGGADNSNGWTWASNGGTDYVEYIRVRSALPTVMAVDRSFSQWNTGSHTNTQAYTGAIGLDNQ